MLETQIPWRSRQQEWFLLVSLQGAQPPGSETALPAGCSAWIWPGAEVSSQLGLGHLLWPLKDAKSKREGEVGFKEAASSGNIMEKVVTFYNLQRGSVTSAEQRGDDRNVICAGSWGGKTRHTTQ